MSVQARSRSHRRRALSGIIPHSLMFDGDGDYVNFGTDAELMNRQADPDGMTIDLMFYSGEWSAIDAGTYYLIGQGNTDAPWDGWRVAAWKVSSLIAFIFSVANGTANAEVFQSLTAEDDTWYYVRARRVANIFGQGNIHISMNAGTEGGQVANNANVSASEPLRMGDGWGAINDLIGGVCYVHLHNVDLGEATEVPSCPMVVAESTVLHCMFAKGMGEILVDTNGHNGDIVGAKWSNKVPKGWKLQ